jgi:hypothetical protein
MAVETAIVELILHAPAFIAGVTRLINEMDRSQQTSSDGTTPKQVTLDEVIDRILPDIVSQLGLEERDSKLLSKVQSMVDRGLAKIEDRFKEIVDERTSRVGPITEVEESVHDQDSESITIVEEPRRTRR